LTSAPPAIEPTVLPPTSHPAAGVLRGALALLSTQPLTWAVSLLCVVLLPRYLGAHGLGEYTVAITIANLTAIVTAFGLPSLLVRQIAQSPRAPRAYIGAGVVFVAAASTLAAVVLSLLLPRAGLPVRSNLLAIVLAGMVFANIQAIVLAALLGQERHGLYAWLNAGTVAISATAGLSILAAGGGIVMFAAAGVATSAVALVVGWKLSNLRLTRMAFSPTLWQSVVRAGIPFLGWNLAVNVYGQIDQILLAFLSRAAEVGWYAAAYRIIAIPVFIPTLIATPLLPALSRRTGDSELFARMLRGSFLAAMVLTVPIAAMIIALAPSIPGILHWPGEFDHSVPLMMVLALHEPFVAADMVLATGLAALRRERQWLFVGLVACVANPTLNIVFIPLMERHFQDGAFAAAVITVGTELLMFVGALRLMPSGILSRGVAMAASRVVLAGIVMWLVTAWLREGSLLAAVVAGGLTFAAAVLVLRAVAADDLKTLISISADSFHRRLTKGKGDQTCV